MISDFDEDVLGMFRLLNNGSQQQRVKSHQLVFSVYNLGIGMDDFGYDPKKGVSGNVITGNGPVPSLDVANSAMNSNGSLASKHIMKGIIKNLGYVGDEDDAKSMIQQYYYMVEFFPGNNMPISRDSVMTDIPLPNHYGYRDIGNMPIMDAIDSVIRNTETSDYHIFTSKNIHENVVDYLRSSDIVVYQNNVRNEAISLPFIKQLLKRGR